MTVRTRRGFLSALGGAFAMAALPPALAASAGFFPPPGFAHCRSAWEVELCRAVRTLDADQRAAFVRFIRRWRGGMPQRHAGYLMHRELGHDPATARTLTDGAIRGRAT